jgi:hypothetical protein
MIKQEGPAPNQCDSWSLENAEVRLAVDRQTGCLKSLTHKNSGVDLLNPSGQTEEAIGGIEIYEEKAGICYSDLEILSAIPEGGIHNNALQFLKKFPDSGFDIQISMKLDDDSFRWAVRLKNREHTNRTLRIHFLLPLSVGWQLWAPASGTPLNLDETMPFDYAYLLNQRGGGAEIHVPIISVYDRECDVGMTLTAELDRRFPGVRYFSRLRCVNDNPESIPYLTVAYPNLGLRDNSSVEASILIHFHEGDWRPGLGWLYSKYRQYFDPGLDRINEQVGTFLCGNIRLEDSWETYITEKHPDNEMDFRMRRLKEIGFQFMEVHDHFPFYGLYAPEAESWQNVAAIERPDSGVGFTVTYQAVRDFIDYLHRHGVYANIYFQFSQCYERYAEEQFSESIARDESGDPIPVGWPYLYVMNADMRLSWAEHCIDQVGKLLVAYPEVDGFFLDCFLHRELDFAHDDGIAMVDNRPCHNINFAYDRITEIIAEKLHSRGLVNFANKPRTIQQTKGIDCVLFEGRGKEAIARQFFLCITRPMIYMWMDGKPLDGRSEEEYLKQCLLYGAFPQVSCYHNVVTDEEWAEIVSTYQSYLPLIERLRGRRLAFDPDPLQLPPDVQGEMFVNPNGDYVISIISEHRSIKDDQDVRRELEAKINLKEPIQEAFLMLPGDEKPEKTHFRREGESIRIFITEYKCAALIELTRQRK